jgi:hypothetical protein
MDISELKKLIKRSTSVLILDNGDPSMVILDYKFYKDLISEAEAKKDDKEEKNIKINHNHVSVPGHNGQNHHSGNGGYSKEAELLERLNREILALSHKIQEEEKGFVDMAGQVPID